MSAGRAAKALRNLGVVAEFIGGAGLSFGNIILHFSQKEVERSRVGIFLDLAVPLSIALVVEPPFQLHKLLPGQVGDRLLDFDYRTHAWSLARAWGYLKLHGEQGRLC